METPRPARLATAALLGLQQTPASSPPPPLPAPPPSCRLPPPPQRSLFILGGDTDRSSFPQGWRGPGGGAQQDFPEAPAAGPGANRLC